VTKARLAIRIPALVGVWVLGLLGLIRLVLLLDRHSDLAAVVAGGLIVVSFIAAGAITAFSPRVPRRTILELDLTRIPPEKTGQGVAAITGRGQLSLAETVQALERATRDKRVVALLLRPRFDAGPAAPVQELRDAIGRFRAEGKLTLAAVDSFGEGGPNNAAYYLAAACERIVLHPTGLVGLVPPAVEPNFYRRLLDRLGVQLEVVARYEYKSAAAQLVETSLTAPDREQVQALLESTWARLVTDIADSRKLSPADVKSLADRGPFLAEEALEARLVDRLAYTDQVMDELKSELGPRARFLFLGTYKKRAGRGRQKGKAVSVGLIHAAGEIHRSAASPVGITGGGVVSADGLIPLIRAAAKDRRTKAVVLRIDSPGGSAVASDAIWRELVRLQETGKTLVASMGAVAASGGYYIAAPAKRIVAQPGTITGSIGVVSLHVILAEAKKKLDLDTDLVNLGSDIPAFSVNSPFSPAQRQRAEQGADAVYRSFLDRVAAGRGLPADQVGQIARGRVWTGSDAKEIGLVDELGGLDRAFELALELSGAPAGSRVRIRPYPRATGLRTLLSPRRPESSDDKQAASLLADVPAQLASAVRELGYLGPASVVHIGFDPGLFWLR